MDAVEDISTKLAATFFLPEEEKKTQRKALVEGSIPFYLYATTAATSKRMEAATSLRTVSRSSVDLASQVGS